MEEHFCTKIFWNYLIFFFQFYFKLVNKSIYLMIIMKRRNMYQKMKYATEIDMVNDIL